MSSIYTGVGANWLVPGIYINVDLGRGTPSAALETRKVLVIGNMLDKTLSEFEPNTQEKRDQWWGGAGGESDVADVDKVYMIPNVQAASRLFGYGSELYLMAEAAFRAYTNVELWGYVQAEATGTGVSRAGTGWIQVAAGTYLDGTLTVSFMDQSARVRIDEGDDENAVAQKIAAAFNDALRQIPYFCEYDTGTNQFRIQAKHPGEVWSSWDGKVASGTPSFDVNFDVGSTGVAFVGGGSDFPMSAGEGTLDLANVAFGDDSPLLTRRFHYVIVPTEDVDNLKALSTFVTAQADPIVGLREQGIGASRLSWADTFAQTHPNTGVNEPRVQLLWAEQSRYFPGQLGAAMGATRARWEGSDAAANISLKEVVGVPLVADENLLTSTQKQLALSEGVTPLVPEDGRMVILRSVTTAANALTNPVVDTPKVTVSDLLADDIELKMATRYKGFKLSPDTELPLPSRVTTPSKIRESLLEWLREHEKRGIITRVTELSDAVKVEIDPGAPGRVNFEIPEDVVDIFAVGAGNIIQIG